MQLIKWPKGYLWKRRAPELFGKPGKDVSNANGQAGNVILVQYW